MRSLRDVYESARANIPLSDFPERPSVPTWDALSWQVRSELDVLRASVLSVVREDSELLASHHRVITVFNRGLRHGYFADSQEARAEADPGLSKQKPFQWGFEQARQAASMRGGLDAATFGEFIRATHLLAYEFGQLEEAYSNPFEFVRRSVGPQRAQELGDLCFALPVLINYRPELVREVLHETGFDFQGYYAAAPPAPSHLQHLERGLVALFDPVPESWITVAANMYLATQPFVSGESMRSEDFHAPDQAAQAVAEKPITARTLVQRQMDRVALARSWIGFSELSIEVEETMHMPALWDAYQLTPASRIRGSSQQTGDLVAFEVVRAESVHVESIIGTDESTFAYLRLHFPAFAGGLDQRSERVVDPRALPSASRGAAVRAGLLRYAEGGHVLQAVSGDMNLLGETLHSLEHAVEDPVAYVTGKLEEAEDTPVVAALLELFAEHGHLAEELFQEYPAQDFFSSTSVQTESAYDLLRSALFHLVLGTESRGERSDEAANHYDEALKRLRHLLERYGGEAPAGPSAGAGAPRPGNVVLARAPGRANFDERMRVVEHAEVLAEYFETLIRLIRNLVTPLQVGYGLARPRSRFRGFRIDSGGEVGRP